MPARSPTTVDPAPDGATHPERRAFLRGAALAGAGAAAATVVAPAEAEVQRFPPEPGDTVYRVTPHIERFYALNRL
jgi:hypothetical protein